jgi:hypothetical protein
MLKQLASGCAVLIVATAFSIPAEARVARVGGAHVGNFHGARVAAANRGIYRTGVRRGQYGRYAYGYRPYWGGAAVAAGVATGAAALAWRNNYYGYAYDNGYGYGGMTYQGGPRYPYYQRPYGYGGSYRNWTQF